MIYYESMNKYRKTIYAFLFSIGILAMATILLFLPIWDDEGPVHDEDLLITIALIPEADKNAYTYIQKFLPLTPAEKTVAIQAESILQGEDIKLHKSVVIAQSKYIVDTSKRLVPLFIQAGEQDVFRCTKDLCIEDIDAYTQIHNLMLIHAYYYARQGDTQRAVQLLSASMHFGFVLATQENTKASASLFLVGDQMMSNTLAVTDMLNFHGFMAQKNFGAYHYPTDFFSVLRKRVYMEEKAQLLEALGENSAQRYWLLPNKTLQTLASVATDEIALFRGTCDDTNDTVQVDSLYKKIQNIPNLNVFIFVLPNMRGKALLEVVSTREQNNIKERICAHNTRMSTYSPSVVFNTIFNTI